MWKWRARIEDEHWSHAIYVVYLSVEHILNNYAITHQTIESKKFYKHCHVESGISSPCSGGWHWLWPPRVSEQSVCVHPQQQSPEEQYHATFGWVRITCMMCIIILYMYMYNTGHRKEEALLTLGAHAQCGLRLLGLSVCLSVHYRFNRLLDYLFVSQTIWPNQRITRII